MTPPGPRRSQEQRSPGICLRRQPGLQRLREGQQSPRPRLTPWGSVRGAHRVLWVPFMSAPERTPPHTHTFPHTEAPMPRGERINPWVGCRSRLSREGVRLEQGNPQRPRRGGGHEPEVQAQLPAKAKVRGYRQSQLSLHPPPPKAPFPSSNLSGLTHRVS